jgi:hypothetical protein
MAIFKVGNENWQTQLQTAISCDLSNKLAGLNGYTVNGGIKSTNNLYKWLNTVIEPIISCV